MQKLIILTIALNTLLDKNILLKIGNLKDNLVTVKKALLNHQKINIIITAGGFSWR